VASALLPAPMRPHVAAVYAFARLADDIADQGSATPAERQAELRVWQDRLHLAAAGSIAEPGANGRGSTRDDLITFALAHSMRSLDLPVTLFDDLLSAFGQDTMTKRYASWADVFDYCRRSANPIGRLVLRIAGYREAALEGSSDALCTALQLTNFWQDFGRDWRVGRLYVPRDEQVRAGACEDELAAGCMTAAWSRALEGCIEVTRAKFDEGRSVCDKLTGRLRMELRLTWLGGVRVLDRVERRRMVLLDDRPTLGAADVPVLAWQALRWRTRS